MVVSIHQNSYHEEGIHGAQVFYYSHSSDGEKAAVIMQKALLAVDSDNTRQAKANDTYYILKRTEVPTVIVECGFLSNNEEAEKLVTKEYQQLLAEAIIVFLILGSAIWFTIRMHFVQVRNLKHQFSLLFKKNESLEGISPFEAFCTVVGYRVGTANIAGVAVAVFSGGPGAVLWMLITSILDAAISYAECALGQVYKIKQDGEYRGGAYYYIERGMGLKGTAIIYALLTLIDPTLLSGIKPISTEF